MNLPDAGWPDVLLVAGPAASGKTVLATALAGAAGYVLLDLDQVTGPLTEAALALVGETPDALDRAGPGRDLRAARYACLTGAAAANLDAGHRVVVVAPFTAECADPIAFDALRVSLGQDARRRVVLVYLDAPPSLLGERLARRAAPRDRAKLTAVDQPVTRVPRVPHLRVDGTRTVDAQIEELLAHLGPMRTTPTRSPRC